MFNQTNLIVGSLYAISAAVGGICALGIAKITHNESRTAKIASQRAIDSASNYLQSVYHTRVKRVIEMLESSDISPEFEEEIRNYIDCPL